MENTRKSLQYDQTTNSFSVLGTTIISRAVSQYDYRIGEVDEESYNNQNRLSNQVRHA